MAYRKATQKRFDDIPPKKSKGITLKTTISPAQNNYHEIITMEWLPWNNCGGIISVVDPQGRRWVSFEQISGSLG